MEAPVSVMAVVCKEQAAVPGVSCGALCRGRWVPGGWLLASCQHRAHFLAVLHSRVEKNSLSDFELTPRCDVWCTVFSASTAVAVKLH